jgi:hypothetical protein
MLQEVGTYLHNRKPQQSTTKPSALTNEESKSAEHQIVSIPSYMFIQHLPTPPV